MSEMTKGSALPRSLSESDQVYLAPVMPQSSGDITVAIRCRDHVSYFADHSPADIQIWMGGLAFHRDSINTQLTNVQGLKTRKILGHFADPLIMGIVNITPDSFSDGGEFEDPSSAIAHARKLAKEGAHILDFGGESTRPGADMIPVSAEIERVTPVFQGCKGQAPYLSIDTRKSGVMAAALSAGANMINDVTALEFDQASLSIAAKANVPICLMHSSADPKVMQENPTYEHVLFDVIDYLRNRIDYCTSGGVRLDNIILDPGIGFGKTLAHNLTLLKGLRFLHGLGCPVLLGTSRKSFIGKIDHVAAPRADERIGGSLSSVLAGLAAGVQIFRVHDVAQTRQAIAIWQAIDNTQL